MYSEFFYDIFQLTFFSCNLLPINISFSHDAMKNNSNSITDSKNLKKVVHKVASIKAYLNLYFVYLHSYYKNTFEVFLAAGVQPILLNTRSICYRRHFFCQLFGEGIEIIVKCLHIFIRALLAFSTKLFVKPHFQQLLLSTYIVV